MNAHDTAAGEKHARARALVEDLWENRSGVVSTQVLQELAVNLRRKAKKPLDAKATRDVVSDYLTWHVVVNGATRFSRRWTWKRCTRSRSGMPW